MASRTGMCLDPIGRELLICELKAKGENIPSLAPNPKAKPLLSENEKQPTPQASLPSIGGMEPEDMDPGTGCLVCGDDDDHANLLLCESCNDEYHTYCLAPPLASVPSTDWFCDKCKDGVDPAYQNDGLDELVSALSPTFTSRFGEVCWAQGGVGFGWWPSFIYDPRFTVGNARQLARKNLGRRHLTYFFECHDAPFAVLTSAKITKWEDGLLEDFHLGKNARSQSRARFQLFQQAFQAANIEIGKPLEMRLDWNHQPQILPPPTADEEPTKRTGRSKKPREIPEENTTTKKRRRSVGPKEAHATRSKGASKVPKLKRQRGSESASGSAVASIRASQGQVETATPIELLEDGSLYCKLLQRIDDDGVDAVDAPEIAKLYNVGFVKLDSRKSSTFSDARSSIQTQLVPDNLSPTRNWRFFVPTLGPVSSKQETSLGPMLPLLQSGHPEGTGTARNPFQLIIVDRKHKGPVITQSLATATSQGAMQE